MAVVKMRKLNLVGMTYEKNAVLNALHRTNAAEIIPQAELENTEVSIADAETLREYAQAMETTLTSLCDTVEKRLREIGEKTEDLKNGFEISYSQFLSFGEKKEKADALVEEIRFLMDERNRLRGEIAKYQRLKEQTKIYSVLKLPFKAYGNTPHTVSWLGLAPALGKDRLQTALSEISLCSFKILNENTENILLHVIAHTSAQAETQNILLDFNFSECPYTDEKTGSEVYGAILNEIENFQKEIGLVEDKIYAKKSEIRFLKTYCDYLQFTLEKEDANACMRNTDRTFLLQAYVPETAEEEIKRELQEATQAVYLEFSDPSEEEIPPTLLTNNTLVSNFEGITNTYSPPNYREFDPNAVMSFFYTIFMGFIIADIGYGLLMAIIGGLLWWKNREKPTGMSRLAGVFACGGIAAVFWGALFNSCLGIGIFKTAIMPNPQSDNWSLAGIVVPSVLIISLVIGIAQLCVGYICKGVQLWRRGDKAGAIFQGGFWAIFSVGMALLILGFVDEVGLPILGLIGGITAIVSLLLAMLTAGYQTKGFGKVMKGLGAAYGVINYASDILSYARLYGLMLSGAVIAQIIAENATNFVFSGNVLLILLGIVLLVVGHGFNLVMNLLGGYIHDCRLQYVEFYGRFYEGEWELFKPFGSNTRYVALTREMQK